MKNLTQAQKKVLWPTLCAFLYLLLDVATKMRGDLLFWDGEIPYRIGTVLLFLTGLLLCFSARFVKQQLAPKKLVLFACFALVAAICANLRENLYPERLPMWLESFVQFFVFFLVLGATIDALLHKCRGAAAQQAPEDKSAGRLVFWAVFALVAISLGALWLCRYYPSLTSPDTEYQRIQIEGMIPYNDMHALGHTVLLHFLYQFGQSYAAAMFAQIVGLALLQAAFAKFLYQKGAPYGAFLCVTLLQLGSYTSSRYLFPWKDIPYALMLGVLTYFIMRFVEGGTHVRWWHAAVLGAALAWTILLRLNGIMPALGCLVYFVVVFVKQKAYRQMAAMLAVALAFVVGVTFYGYGVLKAERMKNGFSVQMFGAGIAAVLAKDGVMTQAQRDRIEEILPVDLILEEYELWKPHSVLWAWEEPVVPPFDDPRYTVFNNRYVVALGQHQGEIISLYLQLLPHNLRIMAVEFLYSSLGFWNTMAIFENATLSLMLLLALVLCWTKRVLKAKWAVFLPVVLSMLSILVSAVAPESRFYLATFVLFVPLLLFVVQASPHTARPGHPGGHPGQQASCNTAAKEL